MRGPPGGVEGVGEARTQGRGWQDLWAWCWLPAQPRLLEVEASLAGEDWQGTARSQDGRGGPGP